MIGLGMLGFLIPYDAVMAMLGVGSNKPVGKVGGVAISAQKYQEAVQSRDKLLNYANRQSLENETWEDLLQNTLLETQFSDLGIDVTEEEFEEITYGNYLSSFVTSTFYGQGQDNAAKENWRNQFENWRDGAPDVYRGYQQIISSKRKKEKWDNLIKRGIYFNTIDGKHEYKHKNDKLTFDFVVVPYTEIPDSLVQVTETDVRTYYRQHKSESQYQQKTERDIEYIEFEISATDEDKANLVTELSSIKNDWLQTDDDSLFCVQHSSSSQFFKFDYLDGDFEGAENDNILQDSIGTIIGPYEHTNYIRLVKLLERKEIPDSAECRHILLKTDNPATVAVVKAKADSIYDEIKAGRADFTDMVNQFSEDPGSVENGGVYEYFPKGRMVPEFERACFWGDIGDLTIVKTTYGFHIVEVLGQKNLTLTARLAAIDRPILPSPKTLNDGYTEANDFAILYSDAESFRNAADTLGYAIQVGTNIVPNATTIGAMRDAQEMVRWAYNATLGEISFPIQSGTKYLIAHLTKVKEEGEPPFENVQEEMEIEVLNQMKAELYYDRMALGENLKEVADTANTRVKKANQMSMVRTSIPGAGSTEKENHVIGTAFGIPMGEMSFPISGEAGLYVVAPTQELEVSEEKDNYIEDQDVLIKNAQNKAISPLLGFYGAMKEAAKVEDHRFSY
jgi:peptidyl-prolyl cis-trans isomerase D